MFLVTRIWDAANDPLMGLICDRTTSRWGKSRPYLLVVAQLFAVVGVLTVATPALGPTGKLVYAYATLHPNDDLHRDQRALHASLMGVMTNAPKVRTSLAAGLFLLIFAGARERLHPPRERRSSLKADLRGLAGNSQWFVMLGAAIAVLIFIRSGMARSSTTSSTKSGTSRSPSSAASTGSTT
jgi:GPH family glycoside/pentoside/hexuronide:cation symporter